MAAYWIGSAQVQDLKGIARYGELVTEAAPKYPYDVLVREATNFKILEGFEDFNRFVVLRFPSTAAAMEYYNSPEYQEARAVRQAASGRCNLVIAEGHDKAR